MLRHLSIRDFVIVDRAELDFAAGFTVLTGETGAGKSILVDALGLVLGERAEAGMVRQGAERAEVSAAFDAPPGSALARWLAEAELAGDDGECLLRRVIDAGGRARAFVNGRPATLQQLKEAAEHLVDIHGQHAHQSLLRAAARRALLDGYGGAGEAAGRVAAAWRRWSELRTLRENAQTNAAVFAAEREQLEWQVRELEALRLAPGEWESLAAEHARLAHSRALIEGAQFAVETVSEGDGAALAQLAAVGSRLRHLLEHDVRLREIVEVLESAQAQAQEAAYMLRDYAERVDVDPQRLAEVEARLDAVHSAARKYRCIPEELPARLAAARERLAALGDSGDLTALAEREAAARADYEAEAKKLTALRRKAAKLLSGKVTEAMQTLAMAGGTFVAELVPVTDGSAHGLEQVEFLVSAHAGTAPGPLAKVASGGELSRVSLAIQTVASAAAQVPTLVFDEVDAGIGGRVAEIVGRMLHALGAGRQVLCVTHLPQVAACADQQWQVAKAVRGERVSSTVSVLEGEARVEEIARMLGGVKITDTTRRHAAEMLGGRKAARAKGN